MEQFCCLGLRVDVSKVYKSYLKHLSIWWIFEGEKLKLIGGSVLGDICYIVTFPGMIWYMQWREEIFQSKAFRAVFLNLYETAARQILFS